MKKTLEYDFIKVVMLVFVLAFFVIPNNTITNAATLSDLTVTQATSLGGSVTEVGTPFNLVFTVSNAGNTSTFSNNTIIFSAALSKKVNYGTPTISKSSGVVGNIECKINGFFNKSLDCKAKGSVSMPAGSTLTITQRVTPTATGTFVNPRLGNKTHCKVDYTSSINGDVIESNEDNNNCTPQSISITVNSATISGSNLVLNPSVETTNPTNATLPENWLSSSWGTNDATFTYPVSGHDSAKALRIDIGSYTDGDARWEFKEIPVNPLEIYTFSNWYKSDTTTYPIVRFTLNDGSYFYFALRAASPSSDWKQFSETFRVPFAAKGMSVSHTIMSVGSLSLDKYSIIKVPEVTP